jgi:hypothetical protein
MQNGFESSRLGEVMVFADVLYQKVGRRLLRDDGKHLRDDTGGDSELHG